MDNDNEENHSFVTPSLSVIEQQERAQIDQLISTAKKFPRDLVRVKRSMEAMATLDAETAEGCNYTLKRKDKAGQVVLIQGPSVRMAEIAVSCFGNIRSGSRIVSNDGKVITGQAFCHDLENNTFIAWETQRRITDKNGRTYGDDLQTLTGNAATAIAFRNAVFKIIPSALIKPVADKALQVAVGDIKTLEQRRQRAIKKFATFGIDEERLLKSLGKTSVAQIDVADVEHLFGIFTAIKEGSVTIEDQFPIEPAAKVVEPNFQTPPTREQFKEAKEAIKAAVPEPNVMRPSRSEVGPSKPIPPDPIAAAPVEAPEPKTKPAAPTPPPPKPPKQAPPDVYDELRSRLDADKITDGQFIAVMADFGFQPGPDGKLPEKAIRTALKDWNTVLSNVV